MPVETWDGTEAAQKLLSAIYRTGQRFGAAHIVDVLLGKATDKVGQHGHEQLSVFGIGQDRASATWRSVTRQLVVAGHLRADAERFGALVLTDTSRGVLRGEIPLQFREDPKLPAAGSEKVESGTHSRYKRSGLVGGAARSSPVARERARRACVRDFPRQDAARNVAVSPANRVRDVGYQWYRTNQVGSIR